MTTGWSVTLNGNTALVTSVATNGPTVVTITIDATATTGHVAGQPFILQTETTTVRVSYSGTGNLTSTGGVTPFTNQLSANNFVFACSELAFFQQGIYPGAIADICSPVNMNFFQFQFKLSLRFRNSTSYNIATMRYAINWGDLISTDAFPYQSDLAGASASTFVDGSIVASPTVVLTARPTHVYPATITPAPNICSWDLQLTPYYNGVVTCFSLARTNIFATYDTDNANSGVLSMPAFTANSDRVCLGNNVSMQFTDNTLLNCRLGAPEAGVPNDLTRHIRIVYGSQDFDSPTLGGVINNIPDVRVTLPAILGGATTQITNNDATGSRILAAGYYPVGAGGIGFPDFNGVIQLPTPVNAATALAYMAQIFTVDPVTNHQVSQRFYVRLEYWDICNVYNSASPDANKVTVSNYVEIITKPVTPVATNKEYCFTETFASGGTCGAPTGEFFEVTAASVTGSTEIKWYNSLADANGDINGITSSYGTNCRFLRPENRTGGIGAMTTAGVYSVFVRYRTNSVAPNNCLSDATEVRITRRSSLSAPGAITPLTSDVCDATNNVPYSLASAAPVVAIGGATEYSWTFSGGTGATVDAPTTAQNITADFNLALAVPTATRNLNVVTQFTTNATTGGRCPTAASTRIVTIYGPTLGGTASGGASYCQGTDASDISLAGERGSVVRWEENFNSGGFFDAGVGSVTFFDLVFLPPVIIYTAQ